MNSANDKYSLFNILYLYSFITNTKTQRTNNPKQ